MVQVTVNPPQQTSVGLENPHLLLVLPILVLVLLLSWLRLRGLATSLSRVLPPADASPGALVQLALRLAAVTAILLAAANPYTVAYQRVSVEEANTTILLQLPLTHVIVLDVSRSMLYTDGGVPRLEAAKRFLEAYLHQAQKDGVEVYVFSSTTRKLCSGAKACIEALSGLRGGEDYSAVGDALVAGLIVAKRAKGPSIVLLVTDGAWNKGANPIKVLENLPERDRRRLVIVRVGSDPRGLPFFRRAEELGVRVYYASLEALPRLLDSIHKVYLDTVAMAVKAYNGGWVYIATKTSITPYLAILGLALLVLSNIPV